MSSDGCIGSSTSIVMQRMHATKRPAPAEMAETHFSKLDPAGQGYIQQSDLQNAFDQISSPSHSASSATGIDELLSQLDSDRDGNATKSELSDTLQTLADQLDQQLQSSRMQGIMAAGGIAGMGGMPPPPPPPHNDAGLTKDELSSQSEQIGSSDDARFSLISSIVENFDKADTNNDGNLSLQEAMAYQHENSSIGTSASAADSATTSGTHAASSSSGSNLEARLMLQIMRLMHAYGAGSESETTAASSLSVTA